MRIYFKIKIKRNPVLNVFGHVKKADEPKKVWMFSNVDEIENILKKEIEKAKELNDIQSKVNYVIEQWENFLGEKIGKITIQEKITQNKIKIHNRQKIIKGTKNYLMQLFS